MNEFQLKTATRKSLPIKMALCGVSSSGKSLGALLIAKGLGSGTLSKTAVIDTEKSIELYSHVGSFQVLNLVAPFKTESYFAAIDACEKSGIETIIIDSISPQWSYMLQLHSSLSGNSFANWQRITPLHNAFVGKLLQSPCNIICTIRSKQDYLLETKEGKTTITKIGRKPIQRNEIEFEFTLVFDINIKHEAKATKDRTGLFMDKPAFVITEETGVKIKEWCNSGLTVDDVKQLIKETTSIEQLSAVYNQYPEWFQFLAVDYTQQKKLLLGKQENQSTNSTNNPNQNNHANITTKAG